MTKFRTILILIASFLSFGVQSPQNSIHLIENLTRNTKAITNIQMTLELKERISGEIVYSKSTFKVSNTPYKMYMKQHFPVDGLEILFIDGKNSNKAWVNPKEFPWKTINLDPLSFLMRKDYHHSIYKSGFNFFIDILTHLKDKYGNKYKDMIRYGGLVKYNNVICHKITFTNPNYHYIEYTNTAHDNLESISYEFKISDFMIYEKNSSINSFNNIKVGETISIPSDYAKSIILYIDKKNEILKGIKVFDEIGLWEEYIYSDVIINPEFKNHEFTVDNPEYNF